MKNEKIIEVEIPITVIEHGSVTISVPASATAKEIEQKALTAEGLGDAVLKYRNVIVDSIPVPDRKKTDEESASEYPEELKVYLVEQNISVIEDLYQFYEKQAASDEEIQNTCDANEIQ